METENLDTMHVLLEDVQNGFQCLQIWLEKLVVTNSVRKSPDDIKQSLAAALELERGERGFIQVDMAPQNGML
jgi:hypothetical protein